MAIHLKTHNDLDAVGCHIALNVLRGEIATAEYHDYSTIDASVMDFLSEHKYKAGDELILADICPTEATCAALALANKDLTIRLFDHHKTRSWVSNYLWATVDLTKSGTELVFDCFKSPPENLSGFVSAVTAWDLWKLDSPFRTRGENLNTLLGFMGKDAFVRSFTENNFADSSTTNQEILVHLNNRKRRYVHQVIKTQLESARLYLDGFSNKFKIIFATDFISEIGNAVLTDPEGEELGYVVVIDPTNNSCSLRSRTGEVDVSHIAKVLGGGGHQAAAGFPISITDRIEALVFRALNEIDL